MCLLWTLSHDYVICSAFMYLELTWWTYEPRSSLSIRVTFQQLLYTLLFLVLFHSKNAKTLSTTLCFSYVQLARLARLIPLLALLGTQVKSYLCCINSPLLHDTVTDWYINFSPRGKVSLATKSYTGGPNIVD